MAAWRSTTDWKAPRRMRLRVRTEKKPSTGHCQPKVCGAAGTGLASADEEPIPIFRQLTRGDPARRLNVRSIPAVAIAGAAAAILAVEDVCVHGSPDLRGTVGRVLPATAAYNVIAGEAEIGVDVRAATEAARDEAVRAIGARFETIASARGLGLDFTVIQDLPATRCDPVLMKVMGDAVAGQGLPLLETLSGAGHDAAVMAKLAPIVMLFIRCEGGISHNPLESVADDDVDVAVRVLGDFIERLALEAA